MWLLLVLVTSCQPASSAVAPPESPPPLAVLTSEQNNYLLREYTLVLPDTEEGRSLPQVQQPAGQNAFRPYPAIADSIRSGRAYWGKVQVVNRLPAAGKYQEWVLTFSSTWTDLEVYTAYTSGDLADWLGTVLFPAHPEYLNLAKIVLFLGLMSYLALATTSCASSTSCWISPSWSPGVCL